jgi:hypothetical protein
LTERSRWFLCNKISAILIPNNGKDCLHCRTLKLKEHEHR